MTTMRYVADVEKLETRNPSVSSWKSQFVKKKNAIQHSRLHKHHCKTLLWLSETKNMHSLMNEKLNLKQTSFIMERATLSDEVLGQHAAFCK